MFVLVKNSERTFPLSFATKPEDFDEAKQVFPDSIVITAAEFERNMKENIARMSMISVATPAEDQPTTDIPSL